MKIKFLLYFFLIMGTFSCKVNAPEFVRCTQQDWTVKNKNMSGSVFHIVLKSRTDATVLKIDSICIQNKIIKDFKYSVLGKSNTSKDFLPNDSILVSFNFLTNSIYPDFKSRDNIFISLKNKRKAIKINTVQKLPSIIND